MKTCSKCGEEKELIEFGKLSRNPDMLHTRCKDCINKKAKSWRASDEGQQNRQKYLARTKQVRKEYQHVRNKNLSDTERLNRNERSSKYKRSDKGKEQSKKRMKEYRQLDKVKERSRLQCLERHALKTTTSDGSINIESMERLLANQDNKCFHCGENLDFDTPKAIHLDHLKPLSKGGQHSLNNVAYSCATCNMSNGSSY